MTEIKITRSELKTELMLLLSHIADMHEADRDKYLRTVSSIADDDDWRHLLTDRETGRIAAEIPGLAMLDITGHSLTIQLKDPAIPCPLTDAALKRLLLTYLVSTISRSWLELAGWPYLDAADESAASSLRAIARYFATPDSTTPSSTWQPPTHGRPRRLSPF